jgi:GNAT superfamily N-acetyltransferase
MVGRRDGVNQKMNILIRQVKLEELSKLRELNGKIMVNNPQYDDDLIADFANTSVGEQFFKESIIRKDGCCMVAEENGEFIGYANGGTKEIPYRKSRYFEIENLGVIPEKKGAGIGIQLLEAICSWAKTNGYQRIYLECYAKNSEALTFYQKHGFTNIDISLEKKI